MVKPLVDEAIVLADKGYHGAGDHVRTPHKGKNKPESQNTANRAHAKLRNWTAMSRLSESGLSARPGQRPDLRRTRCIETGRTRLSH